MLYNGKSQILEVLVRKQEEEKVPRCLRSFVIPTEVFIPTARSSMSSIIFVLLFFANPSLNFSSEDVECLKEYISDVGEYVESLSCLIDFAFSGLRKRAGFCLVK